MTYRAILNDLALFGGKRSLLHRNKFDGLRSTRKSLSVYFGVRASVLTQPTPILPPHGLHVWARV